MALQLIYFGYKFVVTLICCTEAEHVLRIQMVCRKIFQVKVVELNDIRTFSHVAFLCKFTVFKDLGDFDLNFIRNCTGLIQSKNKLAE